MNKKLGFLGNGNMGYAILKGLIDREVLAPEETAVYDPSKLARERAAALGSTAFENETLLAENSDIILAAVKPQNAKSLFEKIGEPVKGRLLLSIVAGYDVPAIRAGLRQEQTRILRIMPNTPAMVGAGVFGLDAGTDASVAEKQIVEGWLSALGIVEWIDESLFPVVTGLSGGGPAYTALFIEALADGGVKYGLKREAALRIAAQTVYGSAKLVLESGAHPAIIKDNVCSPAGTTIEGVQALEDSAFRAAVIRAVEKSSLRAQNLQ
ncbi:MAG: pyrroline-5-carboxylate reductase [Lachnospiraceae bacterium]|nr:pyrroline-5-carboxylate reductase [Lachnospiraceae bacterium]